MTAKMHPNSSCIFPFECNFDVVHAKLWFREHWHHSIYYSLLYVLVIFTGQRFMSKRSAYSLRMPMAVWSTALAAFSILGAVRTVPAFSYAILTHGVGPFICDNSFHYHSPQAYWTYAFTVSKLYELGDTAFIVARKQPLTFLHWYHHVSVFVYCWQGYALDTSTGAAFGAMNFIVHSVMYSYYTLKAMQFHVPKLVRVSITLMQLAQMIVGISITVTVYWRKTVSAVPCSEADTLMYLSAAMYASYLLLFVNFFYQAYLKPAKRLKCD